LPPVARARSRITAEYRRPGPRQLSRRPRDVAGR
jgi:hypothetical protein